MNHSQTMPDRPMSIAEISEEASKFVYNNNISLKHWVRAAASLLKQVCLILAF